MFQCILARSSSCSESLRAIEADLHHANALAASIHKAYGGACIQMRLSCSSLGHVLLFLMQWMDCTCIYSIPSYLGLFHVVVHRVYFDGKKKLSSYERRASLREFYGVIYPSLEQLESERLHNEGGKGKGLFVEIMNKIENDEWWKLSNIDSDRDFECGICLEVCTKMVLPNCNHAMCINCFRDWNVKSQSCPFCRDSLKRTGSSDLWVLTNETDTVDMLTILEENLKRLHLFIDKLPLAVPDSVFVMYCEYSM